MWTLRLKWLLQTWLKSSRTQFTKNRLDVSQIYTAVTLYVHFSDMTNMLAFKGKQMVLTLYI